MQPKISVYIVNFNYGRYIEQAILSVLAQTYKNFEILIIDDGSTDDSQAVISRYALHHKIITIFQENKGLNKTNNVAINRAQGEYIMRLDADDYLEEHALELMVNYLDRHPDKGMVFPDYYLVDKGGDIIDMVRRHNFSEVTQLDQPAHGACTMVRRSNLITIRGYDEAFSCQDGWDLWVRFIQYFGVGNLNLPLFYYRQHGSSLTRDENRILSTRSEILKKNQVYNKKSLKGIAIIPLRGPSLDARSPGLMPLGDKLVVDWTIDAALQARHVSHVIVTSPDEAVQKHVETHYENKVFFVSRDWRLAMVNKPLDDTLTSVLGELPDELQDFEVLVMLYCESPFRTAMHIDSAVDAMEIFSSDRVIAVRRQMDQFFQHKGQGMQPILAQSGLMTKEREMLYRSAGDLFVLRRGHFYRDFSQDKNLGHIEIDEKSGLRITSEWTYTLACLYADYMGKQKT